MVRTRAHEDSAKPPCSISPPFSEGLLRREEARSTPALVHHQGAWPRNLRVDRVRTTARSEPPAYPPRRARKRPRRTRRTGARDFPINLRASRTLRGDVERRQTQGRPPGTPPRPGTACVRHNSRCRDREKDGARRPQTHTAEAARKSTCPCALSIHLVSMSERTLGFCRPRRIRINERRRTWG